MNISVFGMGYVGCVSAACLARDGHNVIGVDVNATKVAQLNAGDSPIIEPGLPELLAKGVARGRLSATTDATEAVLQSDVSLICVGTPSNANGSLKLDYVAAVARDIGAAMAQKESYHTVVVRSTVLPGTVRETVVPLLEIHGEGRVGRDFGVAMNPEFLREGSAIADYDDPSIIVIGEWDAASGDGVAELYRSLNAPMVRLGLESAEMVKYANNLFHALKICFANEIGNICKAHGVNGREVMEMVCRDDVLNISPAYLKPGFAFGGSCLPKDSRAMLYRARERDLDTPLLRSVLASNQRQIERGITLVQRAENQRVGVLGLSFKADTDDVRESPVVSLVETLIGRGFNVSIYDENVCPDRLIGSNKAYLARELPHIASLMRESIDEVLKSAETIVVTNNSQPFRNIATRIQPGQTLIDLVGVKQINGRFRGTYEGICW